MSQKISSKWDVESYYDETEPDEHWQLRKHFMEVHKDKFSEDYLVALAKTFTNIEFLGCLLVCHTVYPDMGYYKNFVLGTQHR